MGNDANYLLHNVYPFDNKAIQVTGILMDRLDFWLYTSDHKNNDTSNSYCLLFVYL